MMNRKKIIKILCYALVFDIVSILTGIILMYLQRG